MKAALKVWFVAKRAKRRKLVAVGASLLLVAAEASACIWDADTLNDEKKQHPTLANAILNPTNDVVDVRLLNVRIQKLRSEPKENDPAWWNDLAGAYIRLGQSAEAAKILEPLTNRFSGDYGVHANLGTAYHLLGRYSDAEREIGRDLEINPEAHFGLEKYHLALLQYLIRDEGYRLRHVYVDEFTHAFLTERGMWVTPYPSFAGASNATPDAVLKDQGEQWTAALLKERDRVIEFQDELHAAGKALAEIALYESPPAYEGKYTLDDDSNLGKGVTYMATLNPKEPACWVMLGMLAVRNNDKNLTIAAYEKAIALGSIQTPILRAQIAGLKDHIRKARANHGGLLIMGDFAIATLAVCFALLVFLIYRRNRPRQTEAG